MGIINSIFYKILIINFIILHTENKDGDSVLVFLFYRQK